MFTAQPPALVKHWQPWHQQKWRALALILLCITLLPNVTFAQSPCPNPYLVQKGDIFGRIAQKCGVTLAALRSANPQIVNPSRIEIGDRINIPGVPITGDGLLQALGNATYQLTASATGTIILVDGYAQRPIEIGLLEVSLVGPWAEGAINQDGARDAAAVLLEKVESTTGRFYSLHALLNTNGALVEVAALLLGDRVRINTLHIQPDGAIVVDLFIQGPTDRMAATLHVVQTYRLQNGQLRLISQVPANDGGSNPGGAVCPNTYPTRLQKGGRAYVLPTPPQPNRIRNAPDKNATIIGNIQPGEKMVILDGPSCANGWIWWYVQPDNGGVMGWTSEGQPGEYWLAPEGSPPPALNFSGAWQTNFAQMTLTQTNNQVAGSYTRYGRPKSTTLTGVVSEQTLTGANGIGTRFSFTLSADGQRFDGYWIGQDGQARQWCGVRSGPLPAGCGFSGVWQATIGGNPGTMKLTQTGAALTGTYNASGQPGQLWGDIGVDRPGIDPTEKMYSAYGQYQGGAYGGAFRFDLLNNESKQLQGCYLDNSNGNTGDWCGWRDGVARPAQCLPVVYCP